MKNSMFIFIFLFLLGYAHGQIVVPTARYQVDENMRIIVSNIPPVIQPEVATEIHTITFNGSYAFDSPVFSLVPGKSYTVKKNNVVYKLYFTELPLANINVASAIIDEPKTAGVLSMSDRDGFIFSSAIGIEIRGGSTQWFPKKSYDLELRQSVIGNQTRDASFFGMRTDDDWLLLGMYNESLRINNVFSHDLWLRMHKLYYQSIEPEAVPGIHSQYVELFINHEYVGIYALAEQVDNKQLKLKKFADDKIRGELYKGSWWANPVMFRNTYPFNNDESWWGGYEYKFPDERVDWTELSALTNFVVTSSDEEFQEKVFTHVDKSNMMDYFIFLNLLRARDNRGKNVYLARYSAGHPYFYVPWDLDGVLGFDYGGGRDIATADTLSNGLFDRLFSANPQHFREDIQTRWFELRKTILSFKQLTAALDVNRGQLLGNAVYEREFLKWGGQYNKEDLTYMHAWLDARLLFLDGFFNSIAERDLTPQLKVYPNPAVGQIHIDTKHGKGIADASITDMRGATLHHLSFEQGDQKTVDVSSLAAGIYLLRVITKSGSTVFRIVLN